MFAVKKLNRNGRWDTISPIDENGSFRGEAKFESRSEAQAYLKLYKDRVNKKLSANGRAKTRGSYKIFELNSKTVKEANKKKYGLNYRLNTLS